MNWFAGALLSGVVAFVFSNFDDVIFLCMWFGQTTEVKARTHLRDATLPRVERGVDAVAGANPSEEAAAEQFAVPEGVDLDDGFSRWHVVAGQVLGFTVLIIISLVGYLAGTR